MKQQRIYSSPIKTSSMKTSRMETVPCTKKDDFSSNDNCSEEVNTNENYQNNKNPDENSSKQNKPNENCTKEDNFSSNETCSDEVNTNTTAKIKILDKNSPNITFVKRIFEGPYNSLLKHLSQIT